MHRCTPVGMFEVHFQVLRTDGTEDPGEINAPIGFHQRVWESMQDQGKYETGDRVHGDTPPRITIDNLGLWTCAEQPPYVSQSKPYRGELCECELRFLRTIPGKAYNPHWRFTFKELTPAK